MKTYPHKPSILTFTNSKKKNPSTNTTTTAPFSMASTSSLDQFFTASRHYLVAGASKDPSKFGNKVLKWYKAHALPVTPLNPGSSEILDIPTAPSITFFYNTTTTATTTKKGSSSNNNDDEKGVPASRSLAVSFVTAPNVTLSILNEIKAINAAAAKNSILPRVEAVWFQPGTYNNSVIEAARAANVPYVIAYGDCILVIGETYLQKSKL